MENSIELRGFRSGDRSPALNMNGSVVNICMASTLEDELL